jgi:hypothetical protein
MYSKVGDANKIYSSRQDSSDARDHKTERGCGDVIDVIFRVCKIGNRHAWPSLETVRGRSKAILLKAKSAQKYVTRKRKHVNWNSSDRHV